MASIILQTGVSTLIKDLQTSKLFAECPNCGDEFSLSESTLFDGSESFPDNADKIRQEWKKELDEKIALLQKRQVMADTGAEKKAMEVGIGKIIEKILPAYKNFNIPLADCRFLSEPIDIIVFDGVCDMKINKITFMDVKTGNARLNTHQKQVRDAVKDHKVKCEVI